jgi:acyl-homoserine-lactone acylase
LLADQIVKYNSERSRYFGPDQDNEGDSLNLISDFSYLALGIKSAGGK